MRDEVDVHERDPHDELVEVVRAGVQRAGAFVDKVHDLLEDREGRGQVVSEVVEDQTAMHLVNRAQVDRLKG